MLKELKVKNFALIEELQLPFNEGFTVITGETGAGKSILVGALSLIQGKRASAGAVADKNKKSVVEAVFEVQDPSLQQILETFDLDYEPETILRREIRPDGKSRAFVNDTPVPLKTLAIVSERLIDIHSQHQNFGIHREDYRFQLLDSFAGAGNLLEEYRKIYFRYKELNRQLAEYEARQKQMSREYDYLLFLQNEFAGVELDGEAFEQKRLELEKSRNAEKITANLSQAAWNISHSEPNITDLWKQVAGLIAEIKEYSAQYGDIAGRMESVLIEMEDIVREIENESGKLEVNPGRVEELQETVDNIFRLQHKHGVQSVEELLEVKNNIDKQLASFDSLEAEIDAVKSVLQRTKELLYEQAARLSDLRAGAAEKLSRTVEETLQALGMPYARFSIRLEKREAPEKLGQDKILYEFSANKGSEMMDISAVASGGELSRLLLALKAAVAGKSRLPTIVFDEIDTGISGEIANKMASIFQQMADTMQLIVITHLPQIAAKGKYHLKVSKEIQRGKSVTTVAYLDNQLRINEIAQMIGGEKLTQNTLKTATELLQ